jgi:hypothetical protein
MAKDYIVFCCLLSSAAAAKTRRHRRDSGLEEKCIQAIGYHSQMDGQQALCCLEPLVKLQNINPWGVLNQLGVGRTFC